MPWGAWVEGRRVAGGQAALPRVLQASPWLLWPAPVWVPLFAFRSPAAVQRVTRRPVLQWRWAWSLARHAFSLPPVVPGWGAVEGAPPDGRSGVAAVGPLAWRTTESDSTNRMRWRSRAGRAIPPTRRIRAQSDASQSDASTRVQARRRWLCSREGRCRIKFGMRKRFVRQRASRQPRPHERARSANKGCCGAPKNFITIDRITIAGRRLWRWLQW